MNRKTKIWRKSIAFGIASAIAIVLTYIKRPEDIHYAGSRFAYNLTFFFPIFILSLILGIISILYFIKYLKDKEIEKNKISKIVLPLLTVLPIGIHFVILMVNFILILTPHKPKYYEPVFTTRQIEFEKPKLTLYLHGALFGELHMKRIVYLTENPIPETNPDNSKIYKYEGGDKVFLYYKTSNDTLDLFIPKGLVYRPSSFNKNIVVRQHEYTYEEQFELIKLNSAGVVNSFIWGYNYKQPVHNK